MMLRSEDERVLHDRESDEPTARRRGGRRLPSLPVTAAVLVVAALAGLAVLAPALAPDDPLRIDLARSALPPTAEHPLGTDRLGRDLFSRWLFAAQASLGVAAAAASIGSVLGVALGILSGYRDGWTAGALAALVDVAFALPVFFVALAFQALLPPGAAGVVLVLALTGWMAAARLTRGAVLRVRREGYVEAARALGVSDHSIVLSHIVPNCVGTVAVAVTAGFGEALLLQSSLSFLGLGIPPPSPSWGGMLLEAMPEMVRGAWWLVLVPGLSILAATAAVGALADSLRQASDRR